MRLGPTLAALAALVATATPVRSQDVELLSEIYRTPLPRGYYETRARDPGAFQFAHGRSARLRERVLAPPAPLTRRAAAMVGPGGAVVAGTLRIPVVLGLFSDSPAGSGPYPAEVVHEEYFGEGPGTIKAYWTEVSGGRVTFEGDVQGWVRATSTQAAATGEKSGLVSGTVGPFILQLLSALPPMDWGVYDNDGPDGVPNSGDDDGWVDALAVLHPTQGAECGGTEAQKNSRVWSHKWTLRSAAGSSWTTMTPSARGGMIKVDDYFIQPVVNCSASALNEIGIFTHEAGHAFGLPDLYDTYEGDGKHAGAGNWDLMATGAWGCDGRSPESPCHLGAWSKALLGWVDVVTLGGGRELGALSLPPVESGGTVYRVDAADGSGEYYLLENRQRLGFDSGLVGTGLLVWQISPELISQRWASNTVNAFSRLGVWLRQADGLGELETPSRGRGNQGDPFPYVGATTSNHVFHAGSNPASRSQTGTASGVTLLDIQRAGQAVTLRASTRFTAVTVRTDGGTGDLLAIDGAAVQGSSHTYTAAPFDPHEVTAAAGESLGTGVRRPFIGWDDDASAPRVRILSTPLEDVSLTARYGGRQVELAMAVTGGVNGVEPATFRSVPPSEDLWFTEGMAVTLEAIPTRGFGFLQWSGVLAGQPNPATVTMDGPVSAGADFELTYRVGSPKLTIAAAELQDRRVEPENGTAPFNWFVRSGELARGLYFGSDGRLTGAALATGSWALEVEARDARGLTGTGTLSVEVSAPVLPVSQLGSPFLLSGPELTAPQKGYLDEHGNRNGSYDLGDFRAWVLAHPGLPRTAPARGARPEGGR